MASDLSTDGAKILRLHNEESMQSIQRQVSTPPRRVPSLYPTSPPTSIQVDDERAIPVSSRPIAHSLRPKPAPVTMESLREQRDANALAKEEIEAQTLYDMFEVHPSVSEEGLRRAYKRMWACFHPDHFSSYGLYSRVQLEALLNQLQENFELLMNPIKRKAYDAQAFPNGVPKRPQKSTENSVLSSALQPLVSQTLAQKHWIPQANYHLFGARLKDFRERCNISLTTVHERTKISLSMLNYIEEDQIDVLPAPIYLKGFMKELLKLYTLEDKVNLDECIAYYQDFKNS